MPEFRKFGSISRLFRDVVITEKIDGTNACVVIEEFQFGTHVEGVPPLSTLVMGDPNEMPVDHPAWDGLPVHEYLVTAQSRNRVIGYTKDTDNHGFGAWVHENAETLVKVLGPGYHYGEWWGLGIQRGYGMPEKAFSLFNTGRWEPDLTVGTNEYKYQLGVPELPSLRVVPVLYRGTFDQGELEKLSSYLETFGSFAAPGFKPAEGIVMWHKPSGALFKYTIDGDGHKNA